MKQAVFLVITVAAAFLAAYLGLGYEATYRIGYGALTLMAAMISATFLMLWVARATPLALGMAFSWAGTSCVLGWWWLFNLLGRPMPMTESGILFGFLSLYFVGAILHFMVMQRSFGLAPGSFVVPVLLSILASGLLHATI